MNMPNRKKVSLQSITFPSSRALLGIDMKMEYYEVDLPELAQHKPACEREGGLTPTQQHFQPLQILNCKYEQVRLCLYILFCVEIKGWF